MLLRSLQMFDGPPRVFGSITNVADTWPTWNEVFETLTFRTGFNTNTVIIGTTLLGFAAGVIGVFALLRKRSLMSDALSHATLPGIAIAFLVATTLGWSGRSLPLLLFGGAATGVIGVLCIQALLRFTRLHEDAAIGVVLSVFFGAGVVALSYIQNNAAGNAAGLNHFIYGQTAAMSVSDASLMGAIALIAVFAAVLLFKELTIVCFNSSFAQVDGWPISFIDAIIMGLVVAVTVAGLQAVGLILVVAMLIIPPVAARFWTERLWLLVLLAALIGASSGYLGSSISALLPRKPAGAVIVLTSSVVFVLSMMLAPARGVVSTVWRQWRLRVRIAGDHLLEYAFEKSLDSATSVSVSSNEVQQISDVRGWPTWFRPLVMIGLRRQRQISSSNGALTLTPEGLARGAQVRRNHQLWEQYLISYADVAPSHVDWSVDQVEHVLSEDLVHELEDALALRGVAVPNRTHALEISP